MSEKLQSLDLPQNYSALLNKLEKLALDLDVNLENITLAKKEVEISISGNSGDLVNETPHISVAGTEVEYSRYISDIWIGVILTLLIVSIIFFICSCFLYHKFQQWKNTYHAGHLPEGNSDPLNRRYDIDIESLPSYTIVSGLPTYDDALEEFRKAGIILTPKSSVPIIKIFEADSRENTDNADNASINSSCICGASGNAPGIIELTPEQLQSLSQKRLSLQISFAPTGSSRRNSRPRIDLLKQVSRNNMLRNMDPDIMPGLHRSSSALSLNDRTALEQRLRHLQQHRGSLC